MNQFDGHNSALWSLLRKAMNNSLIYNLWDSWTKAYIKCQTKPIRSRSVQLDLRLRGVRGTDGFSCWFVLLPGMGCNECTHPSCQHSLNSLGIGQCVECDTGVLVLDPTSGPKWKMACNKCNVVVHFFEHAHKVQVRSFFYITVFKLTQSDQV